MSSLINKAKDALSGHHHDNTTTPASTTHGGTAGAYDDPRSTNAGPHASNLGNKVDPRVDSDRDNRNDPTSRVGGYGTQGTHNGTGTGTGLHTGPGGVGGAGAGYGTTGTSTNTGPHSSNLANKLDPRVDSDRDHRNDPTSRVGGYGTQGAGAGPDSGLTSGGAGVTGTHGVTTGAHGTTGGYNDPHSTNAGPHSSNLANKLDPRVDSDRDNRNDPSSRVGGYGQTQDTYNSGVTTGGAGGYGTTGHGATGVHHGTTGTTTGGGIGGTSGSQYDDPRSANAGPHSSTIANKLDPRVDSDRDNRNNPASSTGGYGQTQQTPGSGLTGGAGGAGYGTTGTTGTHGAGTTGGYGTGSGPTQSGNTTAQGIPSTQSASHSSNLLNKLDPRVKADKEGNPTY